MGKVTVQNFHSNEEQSDQRVSMGSGTANMYVCAAEDTHTQDANEAYCHFLTPRNGVPSEFALWLVPWRSVGRKQLTLALPEVLAWGMLHPGLPLCSSGVQLRYTRQGVTGCLSPEGAAVLN